MIDKLLKQSLNQIPLDIDASVEGNLIHYLQLLAKWNRAYNLTAVRDPKQMVTRHIMDSLSVVKYISGSNVLDVGSGAGLPGIPLALCLPQIQFTLLDSNGKKTRFMSQVVQELHIDNILVVKERIEDFNPDIKFSTVVSRAYSTVANLTKESEHLLHSEGRILAMKGTYPIAELDELELDPEFIEVVKLDVPGVSAERHLVIVKHGQVLSCA